MKKYDFVFSLGFSCAVTQALRDLGMQRESFPLDWVGAPGPLESARMVAADFKDWFNREDLRLWDVRHEHGHISRVYKNLRTGFGFSHEFTNAERFETHYDKVCEKYDRRIGRFLSRFSSVRNVLAVYLESPKNVRADDAVLGETLSVLRAKFPAVQIDLAYLYEDPSVTEPVAESEEKAANSSSGCRISRGVARSASDEYGRHGDRLQVAERLAPLKLAEFEAEGLTVVKIDYRKFLDGRLMHLCDGRMIRDWLKGNVSVDDQLTPQEMRRFADEKRKAYRQSLGRNPIERWINRKLKGWYVDMDDYLIGQGLAVGDRPLWFDGEGK